MLFHSVYFLCLLKSCKASPLDWFLIRTKRAKHAVDQGELARSRFAFSTTKLKARVGSYALEK